MSLEPIFRRLLEIGRTGQYAEIAGIAKVEGHSSALRLVGSDREEVLAFVKSLSLDDQTAFVKSVAMLEHSVGGCGSVTSLQHLLPVVPDPDRKLLDWVLRNTKSYWYYSHGARSVEELDAIRALIAERRAEGIERDQKRQVHDKARIAAAATKDLPNAVRRGDLKAVRALIAKEADPATSAPDGSSLIAVAASLGFDSIASELRLAKRDESAP